LFVLDQPGDDEGVGGDYVNEGVEVGRDGTRVENLVQGASTAETAGDDTKVEANVTTEALEPM
jgi:hypothetical protein